MNDTPRTDAAAKLVTATENGVLVHESFANKLERELAAANREIARLRAEIATKDAGIASMRVQLRDADKEMLRFHRLEDELTVKYAELADAKTTIANMTEALEAVLESPLPARKFFTLAAALKTKKEASK